MRVLISLMLFAIPAFSGELITEGIIKQDIRLKPSNLVNEYVKRDAKGDFLQTNEWWNKAVVCPACMGGPDTFTVISSYEIKKINEMEFSVIYQTEGEISGQNFTQKKKTEKQSFTVVKTEWGFKLNNKAYQMVYADAAMERFKSNLNKKSYDLLERIKVKKASE